MHQWMNLLGHLETDEAVNALNSIVFLATMALKAQFAIICVTFELDWTFLLTVVVSARTHSWIVLFMRQSRCD